MGTPQKYKVSPKAWRCPRRKTDFPKSFFDRDFSEEARSAVCKSRGPRIPSLDQQQQQHLADSVPSNRAKRTLDGPR